MPSKKILVQEDHLYMANMGNPETGYLGFYSKSDNNFYKRTSAGVESKLWDSVNHGAGSGLDADMLDGQHASAFALQYHTHANYVAKSGDTMSGDLSIVKSSSSPYVEAYYRVAAQDNSTDATQGWLEVGSSQNSGYVLLKTIRTVSGVASSFSLMYADLNANRGNSLHVGDVNLDNIAIIADLDVIGNATHVYVTDVDGWVKKVPVSSFGGGGGGGTVTSVGLAAPSVLFGVTNSPVTTSGTISLNLNGQAQNSVFAGPTSGTGTPTFRALVSADIPTLNYMPATQIEEGRLFGRIPGAGAGFPDGIRLGAGLGWDIDGQLEVTASGGGSGTVTSVGLSMPNIFSVSGTPVTSSGTLTAAFVSQSQRLFFASPASGSGVPSFRAITANDLPDLSGSYDFYGSWNVQVNDATTKMILKSGSTQYSTMFNGIKLIAGSNITITESVVGSALGITIAAAGGGGLSYASIALNQSPEPISANTWTDIPAAQYATWGSGSYLIMGTIQVTKSTTGAGLVAARIILSNGTVIASAEHYHYTTTTNRMSFTLTGIYQMGGGAALTAKLQIWSNQTGWSAVANTPTTNSIGATKIEVIKIS